MAPVAGNSGAPPLGELQVSSIPKSLARAREKTPDARLPFRDPARSHPTRDLI